MHLIAEYNFGIVNLRAIRRYVLLPMEWMSILGFLLFYLKSFGESTGIVSALWFFVAPLLILAGIFALLGGLLSVCTWISTGSTEC
jgi:fumarate reductase subunit C